MSAGRTLEAQKCFPVPSLRWRQDEEAASRPEKVRVPRTWRTRKDPFECVWCDVLEWLQEDPDASAVALLDRLQSIYPDQFGSAHLRTLQRRVQQWRGIMASKLVLPRFQRDRMRRTFIAEISAG